MRLAFAFVQAHRPSLVRAYRRGVLPSLGPCLVVVSFLGPRARAEPGTPPDDFAPSKTQDFDGDGFVDFEDDCPTDPAPGSERGCPAVGSSTITVEAAAQTPTPAPRVARRDDRIELLEPIRFRVGTAEIVPQSAPLLKDLVAAARGLQPTQGLQIEGHTDNRGSQATNRRLSQARAEAVAEQLIRGGIAARRITSVGIGPDRPVATNATAEGRAKNRRVEIRIVELGPPP